MSAEVWFLSLSRRFLRFIYAVALSDSTSFLFIAKQCSIVSIYHILFIHMSIDGQLNYSYLLAVVNSAAMNICIQVSEYLFSILGGIHLGVELQGHTYLLFSHSVMSDSWRPHGL